MIYLVGISRKHQDSHMFSFLLCTLNRLKLVQKWLESLVKQEYKKFEVIVVDHSQNDEMEMD